MLSIRLDPLPTRILPVEDFPERVAILLRTGTSHQSTSEIADESDEDDDDEGLFTDDDEDEDEGPESSARSAERPAAPSAERASSAAAAPSYRYGEALVVDGGFFG